MRGIIAACASVLVYFSVNTSTPSAALELQRQPQRCSVAEACRWMLSCLRALLPSAVAIIRFHLSLETACPCSVVYVIREGATA